MVGVSGEVSTIIQDANPYKDLLFIIATNEDASRPLRSIIFDGANYMNQSKSINITVEAKNKLWFLQMKHSKHVTVEEEIRKQERCDHMVRSWLLLIMKFEIAAILVNKHSNNLLWEEIIQIYTQTNAPQLFSSREKIV